MTLTVFTGNTHHALARDVARHAGVELGRASVEHFSDGEVFVEVEQSVRGLDCFVVQPICTSPNEALMELLIMVDALHRASARSIVAVIPYFGYARQDRKTKPRTPITAKLVANLLTTAGVDRVVSVDLHAAQIQGFFDIPFDHLYARPSLIKELASVGLVGPDTVVVSPDVGGVARAREYSERLGAGLAIINKRRPRANECEVMGIIGDVRGKHALLVDDMIDTAGTLVKAAHAVLDAGALTASACATHGVLSGGAVSRVTESRLSRVFLTDTIPPHGGSYSDSKITTVSVAPLLSDAVRRIHEGRSLTELFA